MTGSAGRILSVAKRELLSSAASPVAWIFIASFLLITGFCTFVATDIISLGQADLTPMFSWMPWLFLLSIPALGMPLWSDEMRGGTFELLVAMPAEIWELVAGKFLAGMSLLGIALALTFPAPLTLMALGEPDLGSIACGYAGAFMLGAVYLSASCLCSSLFRTQTSSFLLSMGICAALALIGWPPLMDSISAWVPDWLPRTLAECSTIPHYQSFQRGTLDTSEIAYCVSMTGFFLWLTAISLGLAASGMGSVFKPGCLSNPSARRMLAGACLTALCALLALVSVNILGSAYRERLDLSSDGAYSLSPEAKALAAGLDHSVTVRLYFSGASTGVPPQMRRYAERVSWLLEEFSMASGGRIKLRRLDPEPDSDAAESAAIDGVRGVPIKSGETIFLGLSMSYADRVSCIPFLSPEQERLLEYEICRALLNTTRPEKPKVGVMSAFNVMGDNPQEALNSGKAPERPWHSIAELSSNFLLVRVPLDAIEIPDGLDGLLVIQPSGIGSASEYAIDQYLMKGGRLAAFLDPRSFYAILKSQKDYSLVNKVESTLDRLLPAWGLSFNKTIIVSDMLYAYRKTLPGKMVTNPLVLNLTGDAISKDSPICGGLNLVSLYFTGFFQGTPAGSLKMETLLKSSKDSQAASAFIAERPELAVRGFAASGQCFPMAIRLSGKFKSSFAEPPQGASLKAHLAESSKDSQVFLFGDSDMLFNDVCVKSAMDALGQQSLLRLNDNMSLLQNTVEFMCGSGELASLLGRRPMGRPLTKVNEIKLKAELAFKDRILGIERDLSETQSKLNKLQAARASDGRLSLTPEQKSELASFTRKVEDSKKELKQLRKQFKADLDSLDIKVKLINVLAAPAITLILGLAWPHLARLLASRRKGRRKNAS